MPSLRPLYTDCSKKGQFFPKHIEKKSQQTNLAGALKPPPPQEPPPPDPPRPGF